jgi:alginate O-acetyltransferase complex protein AlgI
MLFPTIDFFFFFAIVFAVSWSLNKNNTIKKIFLLLASYVFYGCWDPRFVPLLIGSSLGNYVAGRAVAAAGTPLRRQIATGLAVAANLCLLGYFKYYDFFAVEIENLSSIFGKPLDLGSTGLILPVGISFITFHGISYVVDVARGKTEATRSPLDLMLYIAFFPHLVAGPIVRAADFLAQLSRPPSPGEVRVGFSVFLILGGLFKKIVIASHVATLYVDPIFSDPASYGRLDLILGAYAYAIVIYCDFSAYTDIAIGVANLLGYRFPQNFNQPYRALTLQDFWRRWHMSLSSWLRDYLYIPLGGNRHGEVATYRNLMLTMTLGGLWHGAGIHFIVWGFMHGLGLAIERFADQKLGFSFAANSRLLRIVGWLITFNFVCVAWIFFRAQDLDTAIGYFRAMIADDGQASILSGFVVALMAAGFLTQFVRESFYTAFETWFERSPLALKVAISSASVWATSLLGPEGVPPFIYFQF